MQQNTYTHSTLFRETFSDNATRPRWYLRYSNTHLTYINWWKHWNKYIQTNQDKEQLKVKQKQKSVNLKTKQNHTKRNHCWYRNSVLSPMNLKYLKENVTITEKNQLNTHTYWKLLKRLRNRRAHTHLEQLEPLLLHYYNYSATLSPNIFTANR